MPTIENAVIAAAGLGSRLGFGMPKCLVEVGGIPIIWHQLSLLKDVADVRVVVGFDELKVIEQVRRYRSDVTFVRNPNFRGTTTAVSYALGAKHLNSPCLYMDGDIIFEKNSFEKFVRTAERHCPLIGITEVKTVDAVYVRLDQDNQVVGFSREDQSADEWANIVYAPPRFFETAESSVFEFLTEKLPLPSCKVVSYEVDREEDLERANAFILKG